ncbi:MAG TPA: hypothetical protein VGF01_20730 [Terracidiphilus sp.]|jgi:lysylphosphatidylglycerol synthetase-like protein (DUF2156 family)
MTNQTDPMEIQPSKKTSGAPEMLPIQERLPLPGLAAISLYLLILAGVIIFGVVAGRHYPIIFLLFAASLIAASAGLILLLRWAWAMALAAVLLLSAYDLWIFFSSHQLPALVQGLLNLVFFLYLVRNEVRGKLR